MLRTSAMLVCLNLLGCHRDESPPAPSGGADAALADAGALTAAEYDRQAALADCTFLVRCGIIGASEKAACEAAVTGGSGLAPSPYSDGVALAEGRVTFDESAARACLDIRASRGCTPDLQSAAAAMCDRVYAPAVPLGGRCLANPECIEGHCARAANSRDGCPGTCTPFAAIGSSYSSTSPCAPDAFCDTTTKKCTARGKNGEACGADGPFCALGSFCQSGICAGRGALGARCTFTLFGSSCAVDLYCDGATNECSTRLGAGSACSAFAACQDGFDCIGLTADDTGTITQAGNCGSFLDAGQACASSSGVSGCPSDMLCASSKCTPSGALDGDCSTTGECRDGMYCEPTTKRCKARLALGAACTPPPAGTGNPCVATTQCNATSRVCTLICM